MEQAWLARTETPDDAEAVRRVVTAAFETDAEDRLVEALRADPAAWVDGLGSVVEKDGEVVGYALITRCRVGDRPALALAPCAVLPELQGRGVGSAAVRHVLEASRGRDENLLLVLGHPGYYPRFGFVPASAYGVRAPFEVPDEAMMALVLDPSLPVPAGTITYPPAFGV